MDHCNGYYKCEEFPVIYSILFALPNSDESNMRERDHMTIRDKNQYTYKSLRCLNMLSF